MQVLMSCGVQGDLQVELDKGRIYTVGEHLTERFANQLISRQACCVVPGSDREPFDPDKRPPKWVRMLVSKPGLRISATGQPEQADLVAGEAYCMPFAAAIEAIGLKKAAPCDPPTAPAGETQAGSAADDQVEGAKSKKGK